MGFYDRYILPELINFSCGLPQICKQRNQIVPLASGRVLEIGFGSGLNLPFYNTENVERLFALEPSEGMRKKSSPLLEKSLMECQWLDLEAEQVPLEDNSIDTVVLTYTLCTIPGWQNALQQMRRVLKPDGVLLFSEHGLAPDEAVRKWQDRLNPVWNIIAGGCHLNRDIPRFLRESGFDIQDINEGYMPKSPRFASYNYRGIAKQKK
ncbi:class I SAM-dependent methyltransferase [Parendozoicomonas sp. Alg238-R29]|uniref:class I SAM-dependent methyltransferase n=1 Tax=Parendozoicomonas sp. Alg238-R29 TaxID=2993446 RepID=UPI00248DE2B5|nr:class I SAM-dependent methyltransferase [Parendozoicomonas sp. Alg238-R29]